MKTPHTDGDIVKIAQQMQLHLDKVTDLYLAIERSEHPNKEQILWDLRDNTIPVRAWPTHIIHESLQHPEQWETGDFGIRFKGKESKKSEVAG